MFSVCVGVSRLGALGERVMCFCELVIDANNSQFPAGYEFDGSSREDMNYPFGRKGEPGLVFLGTFF